MLKGAGIWFAGTVSLLFLTFHSAFPQDPGRGSVRIMFYNVGNLFDISNDTVAADEEFLPDGARRWTFKRLDAKINLLSKTILAAGGWAPPDIVAMCEIENRGLNERLINTTALARFKYDVIHQDSPDPRGIDVCLIYRPELIKIVSARYLVPANYNERTFKTRNVLHARFLISGDTLDLFVNHWPSRRGGVLSADQLRNDIAAMIRKETDSILSASKGSAKIIVTGDFNCNPGDKVINILTDGDDPQMINLSALLSDSEGTYRYQGTWEMIDQMIVSESLLNPAKGLYTEQSMIKVFKAPFLLYSDPKYPGLSPLPTYGGYQYKGGLSDHLPVILDLSLCGSF